MISDEILNRLREHAALLGRYELTALLERYEQLRDPRPQACPYGHPYVPENTYVQPGNGGRCCRHCRVCHSRATRAGLTLPQYYEAHPEAVEYRGFPVAGARQGRRSGLD